MKFPIVQYDAIRYRGFASIFCVDRMFFGKLNRLAGFCKTEKLKKFLKYIGLNKSYLTAIEREKYILNSDYLETFSEVSYFFSIYNRPFFKKVFPNSNIDDVYDGIYFRTFLHYKKYKENLFSSINETRNLLDFLAIYLDDFYYYYYYSPKYNAYIVSGKTSPITRKIIYSFNVNTIIIETGISARETISIQRYLLHPYKSEFIF